jgi:uncharacterized protein (DUF362 family)
MLKAVGATGAGVLIAGPAVLKSSAFGAYPAPATSDVSFVGSSSSGTRRQMIIDVLTPFQTQIAAGIAGKNIIIKANCVYNNVLCATHVDALRGLLDFLRNTIGTTQPIVIADASAYSISPGTSQVFTVCGYPALTTEYSGVTLLDLNSTAQMPSATRHIWTVDLAGTQAIAVSTAFLDQNNYVISICRPKTHNGLTMTGTVKNICMAMPLTVDKHYMHGGATVTGQSTGEDKCLSYNVFQLANLFGPLGLPNLAVLDAWEGMEGQGPVSGTSIMQYCAVAGMDFLAVDRLAAKLMGFSDTATEPMNKATPSYTDMRYLVWMSNAGLGNYDLAKINFIHGSLTELTPYIKSYTLNTNYTGTPSYETMWAGGPPTSLLDPSGVRESRFLDPKPFLAPQARQASGANGVKIDFSLPVGFRVDLGIYNLQGTQIRNLGQENLPSGRYSRVWDCRDNNGARVTPGRYIIRLRFDSREVCDQLSLVS